MTSVSQPSAAPDVTGADITAEAQDVIDTLAQARELASQLEAENTERVKQLLMLGASPLEIQVSAIQVRIEHLADFMRMPPIVRAAFDVGYEQAMGAFLDKAKVELGKSILLRK